MLDWRVAKGFTLIELVIVIVLLGIVATFTFRFVGIGADMFVQGSERIRVLEQGRFVVERLSRELRHAVPNSVRTSSSEAGTLQCLEFVPIRTAGRYQRSPTNGEVQLVSFQQDWVTASTDRAFIYATQPVYVYGSAAQRYVTIDPSGQAADPSFVSTLSYAGNINTNSPLRRLYIGAEPVSYCLQGSQLYRYGGYGWSSTQPTPNTGLTNGTLMAERLNNSVSGQLPFSVTGTSLRQSGTVTLYLEFLSNDKEQLFFNYEVAIPNVP